MLDDLLIDAGCLPAAGIVRVRGWLSCRFFLRYRCGARWVLSLYSPAARDLVDLIDYFRLRREFRVRGWENLVDFSKVSLLRAMDWFFMG